jgi:hypothetical protein
MRHFREFFAENKNEYENSYPPIEVGVAGLRRNRIGQKATGIEFENTRLDAFIG